MSGNQVHYCFSPPVQPATCQNTSWLTSVQCVHLSDRARTNSAQTISYSQRRGREVL